MEGLTNELLSEVLGRKINKFRIECTVSFGTQVEYEVSSETRFYINIYELAHKCKEWANQFLQDWNGIGSGIFKDKCWCVFEWKGEVIQFYANTEPETVFKACQWIMEQKEK